MNLDEQMKLPGVRDLLNRLEAIHFKNEVTSPWWLHAAYDASERMHFRAIPSRAGDSLYLMRFWLSHPEINAEDEFESGDSVLLHYFAQGDDDGAMHDHPWQFTTHILSGGYTEELPADDWDKKVMQGPELGTNRIFRQQGDRVCHAAMDLHMACDPLPDTWTMVVTGNRGCNWGFHPPGETWVDYRRFLGLGGHAAEEAATADQVAV